MANKKIVDLSKDYEGAIKEITSYILEELRLFKNKEAFKPVNEIFSSKKENKTRNILFEMIDGIHQRIDMAKNKGWSVDHIIEIIKTELNFSFQEISLEIDEIEKKYVDTEEDYTLEPDL